MSDSLSREGTNGIINFRLDAIRDGFKGVRMCIKRWINESIRAERVLSRARAERRGSTEGNQMRETIWLKTSGDGILFILSLSLSVFIVHSSLHNCHWLTLLLLPSRSADLASKCLWFIIFLSDCRWMSGSLRSRWLASSAVRDSLDNSTTATDFRLLWCASVRERERGAFPQRINPHVQSSLRLRNQFVIIKFLRSNPSPTTQTSPRRLPLEQT